MGLPDAFAHRVPIRPAGAQRFRDLRVGPGARGAAARMLYLSGRMEPPVPPKPPPPPSFTDLPDLFSSEPGSSQTTHVREALQRPFPSAQRGGSEAPADPARGSAPPVARVQVQQITVPSGAI